MRIRTTSKSGLFLVEFMIIFVMFALTAVVCLGFFVKAHDTSTYSKDLTTSTLLAMTIAEEFKSGKTIEPTAFYNEEGAIKSRGPYRVDVVEGKEGQLLTATIAVSKEKIKLYELSVKYCQSRDVVQ